MEMVMKVNMKKKHMIKLNLTKYFLLLLLPLQNGSFFPKYCKIGLSPFLLK